MKNAESDTEPHQPSLLLFASLVCIYIAASSVFPLVPEVLKFFALPSVGFLLLYIGNEWRNNRQ